MKFSTIKKILGVFFAGLIIFTAVVPKQAGASIAEVWGCFYNQSTGQGINDVWIAWTDSGDTLWKNSPGQCLTTSESSTNPFEAAECQTHRPHRRYIKTFKNETGYGGKKCGTTGDGTFYFPSWADFYTDDNQRAAISTNLIDSNLDGTPDTYQSRYGDDCGKDGCDADPARDTKGFGFERSYGFNCTTEKNSFQAVHPATLAGGQTSAPVWFGQGTESSGVSNVAGAFLQLPDLFWTPPAAPSPSPVSATLQCLDIKFYDTSWTQLTSPAAQIKGGDVINIAVSASTNEPGGITKARFQINSGTWQETTTKNSFNEYYLQVTVSTGQFNVAGEVFNSTLGWK